MAMEKRIAQVFLMIILINCVKSQCSKYYSYTIPIEGVLETQQYEVDMRHQQAIGIGFWTTYRPQGFDNIPENPEETESSTNKKLFLFSFQKAESEMFSFLLYADIQLDDFTVTHKLIIQSDIRAEVLTQNMDYYIYEGRWFFVYCYFDSLSHQISLNHLDLLSKQFTQQVFFGCLQLSNDMEIITGGFKNFMVDGMALHLGIYPGYIQPVIQQFEDFFLFNKEQFLQECLPDYNCNKFDQYFIRYNYRMTGNSFQTQFEMPINSYVLQGWIKQDPLINSKHEKFTLLRVSRTKDYFSDDSQVGDKILYVTYIQDTVNLNENGFKLQTYSYQSIWKPNTYVADQADIIQVNGEKYKDLLTQWHYFQFQFDSSEPIFKVYYPSLNTFEEYKWQKKINHYFSKYLFFSIGGDDYSLNTFQGYLSDWIFTLQCDKQEVNFVPRCHKTCLTCKGISELDCTSCDESNFRIFSQFQNTCQCQYGYIDFQQSGTCKQLSEFSGAFSLYEKQVIIKNEGYYEQDQCAFGYFKYNSSCIECPYAVQENLIRCADCIIYPEVFSTNLNCTFFYNSTDKFSVFNYYQLSTQDYELYNVTLNVDQKFKLQKRTGHKNSVTCKESYFLSENNDCQACIEHCLHCKNQYSCGECELRYVYEDGVCVECQNCAYKYEEATDEGTETVVYCPTGMYLKDEICIDCGNHCKDCMENSCYHCENNGNFFITLDNFNCAECQIQKCLYCFQYYIKADQTIVTSLDIDSISEIVYYEVKTGCALCDGNLFYSFITHSCEPKPLDMSDCESGIITEDLSQCLISKTRQDAIQQSICNDPLCLSCINNYSKHKESFCIVCKDGYYATFQTGQCKQCPKNCQTCTEFNLFYDDLWKWNIRAFYHFFINRNNDHYFENHQVTSQLSVICLSCSPNFELTQYSCVQVCSEDCLDCQIYLNVKKRQQFKCNQCKPATFNFQRSVYSDKISQCLTCPDYCSGCQERTLDQIKVINPFFNTSSPYIQYTHICYQPQFNDQDGIISVLPGYVVPNICQEYAYCEKVYEASYYLYCDFFSFIRAAYQEPNPALYDKYEEFTIQMVQGIFETINQEEILKLFNKVRISDFEYIIDLVYLKDDQLCWLLDENNFTNQAKENVFTLKHSNITFRNSQKSQVDKLPLIFMTQTNMVNFNKVTFDGIEFRTFDEFFLSIVQPIVNLKFINDHDPVTISFKNCIIVQNFWEKSTKLTFSSEVGDRLLIKQMKMLTLQISNSSIFNIQPSEFYFKSYQYIDQLLINNSNFTDSSVFMYKAHLYSLHQTLNFTNVTILNTNFSSSFFINSSFLLDYTIGEVFVENFHVENVILKGHSVFFQIVGANKFHAKNLTIRNAIFLDNSSFIVCNILNVQDFMISNSIIYGYVIHIYQSLKTYQKVKELTFEKINFINNTYSNTVNSFIYILEGELITYDLFCSYLLLDNNVLIESSLGISAFTYLSYKYSLIYIQCKKCNFQNIKILRGVGLPEISIIDSESLEIQNLHIETKKQYYKRSLHSSLECSKRLIYQDIPFVLYIWSYLNVLINDTVVENTIIADYQLIILVGKSRIENVQDENISVSNSVFKNNLLLILSENKQSSIISIETQQVTKITMKNIQFQNNFLNQFQENQLLHSSVTLLINAEKGSTILQSIIFDSNFISNSTDSVLYMLVKTLIIHDCSFINQNIITHDIFQQNILFIKNTTIQDIEIINGFQILSNGGNGQIETSSFYLKNTNITNSLAINGGGFYITTVANGIISVDNCSFRNTSTILNGNQLASGGWLYIDSSKSLLNLTIKNVSIQSAYSRTQGGAIYIEPSRTFNLIAIENSIIHSVFSIQHSFLSFSPKKLITISSQIVISNIKFQNTQQEFEKFVVKIEDLQEQNVQLFQIENPLIYAQYCNFTMINSHFDNVHLMSLVDIQQGKEIILKDIDILNCTIFMQPIIKLSLRPDIDIKGVIFIQNVLISNLIEYSSTEYLNCQQFPFMLFDLLCPQITPDVGDSPVIVSYQKNLDNQLNCNLNQLYSIVQGQSFGVIQIYDIKQNHIVYIYDLTILEIKCENCHYGVLNVQEFDSSLQLQIVNLKIINNSCGVLGCLSIIKSVNNLNKSQTFEALKISGEIIYFNTTIKDSIFINNTAQYGGACYLSQIDTLINNTKFFKNQAFVSGGGIYYDSEETTLLVLNSWVVNNKANIGGAIYLYNQQLQRIENLNLRIEENAGLSFANNLYEAPRFLSLYLDKTKKIENIQVFSNDSTIIEQVSISPYLSYQIQTDVLLLPSGQIVSSYNYFNSETNSYVPLGRSLRLHANNIFGEKIANLENTECQISGAKINTSNYIDSYNYSNTSLFISKSSVQFNMETGDYNLDDIVIYFNPYQDESIKLQLAFECNSIQLPFYNTSSYQLSNIITNYILLLNVRTFPCQLGEYLNQSSGGCVLCDVSQSQYSVTINSTLCNYKDEMKISEIQPAMIQLRHSYWRAFYYSEIIEECHNLFANCQGGWIAGNPSCATGHIGAFCEQCDLYNIRGAGEYSQNQQYQCSSCDYNTSKTLNIMFVIIWTLISVFITVTSTVQMIDDLIFQLKLKPLGLFIIAKNDSTSTLLKVFTNYLQIISSIASFQLQIPIGITLAVRGVGNPIGSMAFSLDCYLKFASIIPIVYFRIIWGFAMAGMYIFLFLLFHIITIVVKKKQLNITFVTTTFIYIYIYLSPNSVSDLSFLISYRNISGQQWIAANVAYLYNTQTHITWLIYFVTPTFLAIGIILPFFFWYILYYNRLKLNTTRARKVWGYLYNEYKLSTYYWETIKILKKELIIIILIYYEDYVAIKACLIFFLLHLYSKLTQKLKPYLTENLNKIDSLSTSICKFSIALAQSIYLAQGLNIKEVVWPFYIVLAIINFYFIFEMLSKLLFAYFDKLYEQIDKFRALVTQYIPQNMRKNKFLMRMLRNTTERKYIVRQRYLKIRIYLINQAKFIIDYKKINNMGLQCNEANYSNLNSNTRLSTLFKQSTNVRLPTEGY